MEKLIYDDTNSGRCPLGLVGKGIANGLKGKRKLPNESHGNRSIEAEIKRRRVLDIKENDSGLQISPVGMLQKPQSQLDSGVKEMMQGFCQAFGYRVLHAVPIEYEEMLGKGAFGEVYKWYDPELKSNVAVKTILHRGSRSEIQTGRSLLNEIEILRKLSHRRVIRYYRCAVGDMDVRIFIEYMPNGSVKDYMSKRQRPLQTEFAKKITKQVLEGTAYLHQENILHRDIKASNVLLDAKMNAKLGDFGISKQVHILTNSHTCCHTHVGTPYWMSPERIRGEKYGKSADIWSIGCTLVEMITMHPPWHEFETNAAIFKIGSGLHPSYQLPPNIFFGEEFLCKTFKQQASKRPKATELLTHPFLIRENVFREMVLRLLADNQV